MKTNFANARCRALVAVCRKPRSRQNTKHLAVGSRALTFLGLLLLALWPSPHARADLSAPDNILYGIIVLGTNQITANASDFAVEARRTNGLPVARYRMGDRPEAGNYYVLAINVEEIPPRRDPASALVNETLAIIVLSNSVEETQQYFTVTERGQVKQLDFVLSTNALTGFESWAWARGLDLNSQNLDADADGVSNLGEYLAGTDPNNATNKFLLQIGGTNANTRVSFDAVRAEGVGYEGCTRHYALEWLTNLSSASWQAVPGYSDMVGANEMVSYSVLSTNAPLFFRGKVWLNATP